MMSTSSSTTTGKKRKPPIKREGERYRVAFIDSKDPTRRLSFALSPWDRGYTLRARRRWGKTVEIAVEHLAEAQYHDSFLAGKQRIEELTKIARDKGWVMKTRARSIEDLL